MSTIHWVKLIENCSIAEIDDAYLDGVGYVRDQLEHESCPFQVSHVNSR